MDKTKVEESAAAADTAAEIGGNIAGVVHAATERASSAIHDVAATVGSAASDAATRGVEAARDYVGWQNLQSGADYVGKQGAQALDYVRRNTAEQPWVALLIAGAVGYALAYLVHHRPG